MGLFATAIFSAAFLLFQVQPLIGKYVLPWFGGSPSVWTACLLFFQILLLSGYAYAHLSDRLLPPRAQAAVHVALLGLAAWTLPVAPGPGWKPVSADGPVWRILLLLLASVGAPGLVLSATGPLLQRWFSRVRPGRSPYVLYALSNLGSMLALLSYPFLVEPWLSRQEQSRVWSWMFVGAAALSGACAVRAWKSASARNDPEPEPEPPPGAARRLLWFLLPACACVILLATTNQLCLDVAAIPFLWVLPLALYLLSFVLAFESPRWYRRAVFLPALGLALGIACTVLILSDARKVSILNQILVYSATLFVGSMVCHGELARLKPEPSRLTSFYLTVAAGGASGGVLVALGAPALLHGYFELHAGWLGCALLVMAVLFTSRDSPLRGGRHLWAWALLAAGTVALAAGLYHHASEFVGEPLHISRDFYGVLSVAEFAEDDPSLHYYVLSQGTTLHGLQLRDPRKRRWPTAYYGESSGVGRALRSLPEDRPRRIGVVGLGVGTIAAYGRAGDEIRFYELDPQVLRIAREDFTFLGDTPAHWEAVLGDARLSLEREPPNGFDLLVLDAFSSDAVPVHLLTLEAFQVYLGHLAPGGALAVHVSNAYLDLRPVVAAAAAQLDLSAVLVQDNRRGHRRSGETTASEQDEAHGLYTSSWAIVAADPSFLQAEEVRSAASSLESAARRIAPWTDASASLFRILK